MQRSRTRVLLLATVPTVLALVGYLLVSSPGGVVVSAQGEVRGYVNVARSKVQGERFWREQLDTTRRRLAWELSAPEHRARRESLIEEIDQRTRERREDLYQRNPKARPSPSEERAEALRDEADRIEQAEFDQSFDSYRLNRIRHFREVIAVLEARVN
jgi:hypothetical protein